ncbi:MAG: hypothetical protein ACRCUT_13580, partial [Spirochaetota bacterium]
MNKKLSFVILFLMLSALGINAVPVNTNFQPNVIQQIRITETDIPEGFAYGQIPGFAKKVLQNNPWDMDRAAINKLTKQLYPGGDAASV